MTTSTNVSSQNLLPTKINRRSFLQKSALVAATAFASPVLAQPFKNVPMGLVVHTYSHRWHSQTNSEKYPGFQNALDLLEHCHQVGGGGIQVGVRNWTQDFAGKVRSRREQLGLYVEGSIRLPKSTDEVSAFEQEIKLAKEAGAQVIRTVCLGGRRYETFDSLEAFQDFKQQSIKSLELVEPIVRKHQMRLAVENHKDWRAPELVDILQHLGSEWVGVTLDFGNSISLMEDPMEVVEMLVPFVFSTHVKDMAFEECEDGFLMSEVQLGEGMLDLPRIVSLCQKHNPDIVFNLEMITRDPLKIPCLTEDYWATFPEVNGKELARTLRMVRENKHPTDLPLISSLNPVGKLAVEEENVRNSLAYSRTSLPIT
ncbi:MAG: TIM barrel protein [Tunicatimonas sp.]|uniref:sugar phosphate isomerase/epimerase family protein n=1 Tax=Tunicatimonas sp. TaxID=1940096 RepID=UPI003C7501CB